MERISDLEQVMGILLDPREPVEMAIDYARNGHGNLVGKWLNGNLERLG